MKEVDDKPWLGEKDDSWRLTDFQERWYALYGTSLNNRNTVYNKMCLMAEAMGNPLAIKLTDKQYAEFRQLRLSGEINFVDSRWNRGKTSVATCTSELARFKAVFSKLKELGEWTSPNPLEDIKPLKDHEREMAFLTQDQLPILLPHVFRHPTTLFLS